MPKDTTGKKTKKINDAEEDVEMGVDDSSKKVKEATVVTIAPEDLSPLAHPLAEKKLLKKVHKTIKKASKARQVKRGVKEVVKAIRKRERGILILAGDINPIDIISHLPILSEEAQIPYVFVPSKEELGHSSSTKRPTSCVMVCPDMKARKKVKDEVDPKDDGFKELYDEVYKEIERLDQKVAF